MDEKPADQEKQKPKLVLLRGKDITAESLAEMYKAMTGKDTSPEELEELRAYLEKGLAKRRAELAEQKKAKGQG